MEVVGVAKNGVEACELTERLRPDLALLDIRMPLMNGLSVLKHIKSHSPGCSLKD